MYQMGLSYPQATSRAFASFQSGDVPGQKLSFWSYCPCVLFGVGSDLGTAFLSDTCATESQLTDL